MDRWLLALVAGLLGGAAGALAVEFARGGGATGSSSGTDAAHPSSSREVLERLDRIEALLRPVESAPGALTGRPEAPAASASAPVEAAEEARLRRIEASVEAAVERKVKEMGIAAPGKDAVPPTPAKKRVTLAEASTEVGLSRAEEDTIRRIYDETKEKMVKLIAGENGDVEEVKRDLEAAKTEKGRGAVMIKYLPKVLGKIGELASLGMERDAKVEEALGPERAARWDALDIEEENPLGFGGNVRMEASNR